MCILRDEFIRMRTGFLLVILLISMECIGGGDVIISERPGQAYSPFCLAKRSFQLQSGVSFQQKEASNSSSLRFGLGSSFEVNTSIDIDLKNRKNTIPNIGLKLNMFSSDKNNWSVQYNTFLGVAFEESPENHLTVISNHLLSSTSSLSSNFGMSYKEEVEFYYVLNYALNISPSFFMLLEYYGNGYEKITHYYDAGIGYLVSNSLQIDIYSGTSFTDFTGDLFVNFGVSYRLDL